MTESNTPTLVLPDQDEELLIKHLKELLSHVELSVFQSVVSGSVKIAGIDFHLRLGTYIMRPLSAIVAKGRFISTRQAKNWERRVEVLKRIDPEKPEDCLYNGCWHPDGIEWVRKALASRSGLTDVPMYDTIILDNAAAVNSMTKKEYRG